MIEIDLESAVPLADQIAAEIRRAIAEGGLEPGDDLPPVRQLADDLGVHFNTVARAYRTLETAGLVRTARGRGTRVRSTSATSRAGDAKRLRSALRTALDDARLAGWSRRDVESVVGDRIDILWPVALPGTAS